ncbi:hypothetical protein APH_0590 [Anaplasma phagocytophilum str. HZ]|uniref:Uncharacterized protein n=1 Tax=Anaplasma phagocytophilum (strain HZ) TaxID=212042 RepID=Q2GKC1_ANAPZ|nr:hypothetical protein APH_0590 [Anaplasma phagocytophilum str. HZ]
MQRGHIFPLVTLAIHSSDGNTDSAAVSTVLCTAIN